MKRILLVLTGGTIASKNTGAGLAPDAFFKDLLLEKVGGLLDFCLLDCVTLLNIDSTNIQPKHWILMAEAIEKNYSAYDGFVILHGTDTMAYTSAALSYLIQKPGKPIVLTGSQYPLSAPISDAAGNIVDSVRFACEDGYPGVYLVFSGFAIRGTRAKKMKSKSYAAFSSINYPPAALVEGERILHYSQPEEGKERPEFFHDLKNDVFLLKLIPGMNPDILDYIGGRYRAVVFETFGVGGIPFLEKNNFLDKMKILEDRGCVMVVATQVMLEGSDLGVYEVGRKAMEKYHVLQAYDMTIEAVVTKLMWILGRTDDNEEIGNLFYTPVGFDLVTRI